MIDLKPISVSFILALLTISLSAQNPKICGKINYKQVINLDVPVVENYTMVFNSSQSFSEEINIESSGNTEKVESSEKNSSNITVIGRKNVSSKYYFNNGSNFYFKDIFIEKSLVVKEENNLWDWKIENETKKIGQFNAQKASTNFRGRDYTAWFTKDIPVSYGPWKFRGLPGLILEVYDSENVLHITATKVVAGRDVDCTITIDKREIEEAISLAEYRMKKNELIDAAFAKLSSKLPKGTPALKRDKNCEDCGKELEIFND